MAGSFELPKKVENDLRNELGDVNIAAKEALLIECYRQGRISIGYWRKPLAWASSRPTIGNRDDLHETNSHRRS